MLVYGDPARIADPRQALQALGADLAALAREPAGPARHGGLVGAFIAAGELAQGLIDAQADARGGLDGPSPLADAAMGLLMRLAGAVAASWDGGLQGIPDAAAAEIAALTALPLPAAVRLKTPEGHAFYALYPEAYLEAARRLDRSRPWRVIGIRSIGTGLSALVAHVLGAPAPLTVRPGGHPFERTIRLDAAAEAALLGDPAAHYAIVDEGPGLSGSSFGGVADWLEERGVSRERLAALPSHRGDLGPRASARHRTRWAELRRSVVDLDDLMLNAPEPAHRLTTWAAPLAGPALSPLQDLSGGAWRALAFGDEAAWPPANVQQERRKFLMRTADGPVLLKFAGLGREGSAKLRRAKRLHAAGFAPEPIGLVHGFLLERWLEDARPADLSGANRTSALETLGRYLAFRAHTFPAPAESGASLADLLAMARHNAAQALGDASAARLDAFVAGLPSPPIRRIVTDNRLQAWEWLVRPDGTLVKTDALDHATAHDLIGCQDVAWDVAGAVVEWDLAADERADLCGLIGDAGCPVDPALVDLMLPCYLAFQTGSALMAAQSLSGWPAEAARLKAAAARMRARLEGLLPG